MAIGEFLLAPFSQVEKFASYVSGKALFDTHQGVKGLEFERVMVIMDDEEARGFMFKYENLFGAKSVTDLG
jgi:DNA helicase-2/ATP-dependent DNA helicase PcrA